MVEVCFILVFKSLQPVKLYLALLPLMLFCVSNKKSSHRHFEKLKLYKSKVKVLLTFNVIPMSNLITHTHTHTHIYICVCISGERSRLPSMGLHRVGHD